MSQTTAMRKPLSARQGASRALEERVALRFPRLVRALGRFVVRRPTSSRIRQTVVWRAAGQGLGAANRRDFEAVLPRYHPDVEFRTDPGMLGLDIEDIYRGHEGYLRVYRDWLPAWGEGFQWEPYELIDVGDGRLLALMHIRVRGERSGAELVRPFAILWTLDGEARVVNEEHYSDTSEALEAAGLRE